LFYNGSGPHFGLPTVVLLKWERAEAFTSEANSVALKNAATDGGTNGSKPGVN
jgi:hypothetical protein